MERGEPTTYVQGVPDTGKEQFHTCSGTTIVWPAVHAMAGTASDEVRVVPHAGKPSNRGLIRTINHQAGRLYLLNGYPFRPSFDCPNCFARTRCICIRL